MPVKNSVVKGKKGRRVAVEGGRVGDKDGTPCQWALVGEVARGGGE